MGVRLQTDDVGRLTAAQRVLLSPHSHPDAVAWQLACNRAVRRLIKADHSVFSLPTHANGVRPALLTEDTDPSLPERFLAYFTGVVAGEYRFRDPLIQSAGSARRQAGPGAFHELALGTRDAIGRSTALQEIFRPAGMGWLVGLSAPMPVGEATQFFGFEGADAERRSERGVELLRLLVPAFEAAVRMQRQWIARGEAFAAAFDRMGHAAAIYSATGTLLHHNEAAAVLLARDPERQTLRGEMDSLARTLAARCAVDVRLPGVGWSMRPSTVVRRGTSDYRLVGSMLEPELLGVEGLLVLVERRQRLFPTPFELTARYSLSGREAEAALLIARGLSDAAIARHMAVSPHTARRYSERVLRKLGVHARAAVAITLLEGPDAGR